MDDNQGLDPQIALISLCLGIILTKTSFQDPGLLALILNSLTSPFFCLQATKPINSAISFFIQRYSKSKLLGTCIQNCTQKPPAQQ